MTDYIISEEQLVELDACQHMTEMALVRFLNHIRSCKLSDELKAERERINNELDYIEHVSNIHEYDVTVYLKDVRKIVRGE